MWIPSAVSTKNLGWLVHIVFSRIFELFLFCHILLANTPPTHLLIHILAVHSAYIECLRRARHITLWVKLKENNYSTYWWEKWKKILLLLARRRSHLLKGSAAGGKYGGTEKRKREKENLRCIDGGAECSWGGRGARRILSWERYSRG